MTLKLIMIYQKSYLENDILVEPSLRVFCILPFEIIKGNGSSNESTVHDFYRDILNF